MFRRSDGTKGFSWMRLLDNAVPVMRTRDGLVDPGSMNLQQQDVVYSGQVNSTGIKYGLCETAFYTSGILANESESRKIYKKVQKTGVISEGGIVDTTRVDANFTHQLATVPVLRQKQIVDLLFWWEEESQRLRKLSGEREELEGLVRGESNEAQRQVYAQLLERVRRKIWTNPSERDPAMERDEDELMMRFRNGSLSGQQQQRGDEDERPPAYVR